MRQAVIKYNNIRAGILRELDSGEYEYVYDKLYIQDYPAQFITFRMPVKSMPYRSKRLFPFFDGLIPEGWLLKIASETWRININDRMGLLLACCQNSIGAVSVHPVKDSDNV
jgi:serine/threonine-protein kinase HipA